MESGTPQAETTHNAEAPCASGDCIVVGVGASAGGLEAFQRLLKHLPPHPRLALIYVQHLDPKHESLLPELLAREVQVPVQAVHDEAPVEPGNVYVIPPNTSLTIEGGVLRLGPRQSRPELGKPIDGFLSSLAHDQGDRAVGIILSGTGSDGTAGLRAIKEGGGMTIAQLPESAGFDSMPRSAIAAGLVDYILPPDRIPELLVECAAGAGALRAGGSDETQEGRPEADAVARVCDLLRRRTGHDFAHYKRSTLARRINRRMDALQIEESAEYLRRLDQDPKEAGLLLKEMLIGVTEFFRDPEAFETLAQRVLPRVLEGKGADDQVRLWVVGCATGEEVYSLAILMREQIDGRQRESGRMGERENGGAAASHSPTPPLSHSPTQRRALVQIFATDIDEEALDTARRGRYPESIREHVSPERLERFFLPEQNGYRIRKEIRQMCVFSKHNVLHDPPFPDLDLISCRNLLIYLDSHIQGKVIGLFHYALRTGGFLFLGAAENIAGRPDLFEPVERSQRLYQRRDLAVRAPWSSRSPGTRPGERERVRRRPRRRWVRIPACSAPWNARCWTSTPRPAWWSGRMATWSTSSGPRGSTWRPPPARPASTR